MCAMIFFFYFNCIKCVCCHRNALAQELCIIVKWSCVGEYVVNIQKSHSILETSGHNCIFLRIIKWEAYILL